ncbi:MAG TPA: aspartate/glutamate racemase family protein, partial [Armatimonadota bacterium]
MPNALVINPNTSPAMTEEIERTAARVFQPPWSSIVAPAPAGPESLESWSDYHQASVNILPLISGDAFPGDGIVLACFGDPGLYLLKESCDVPVVGIAEASMSLALLLGARFGILAGMRRAVELMDSMVRTYGLETRYAGTESLDMRVLDFDRDRAVTLHILEETSQKLRSRGAEVLLLGCAGLTGFVGDLQSRVEMPVIDPVEAGCRMLQTLCAARLNTSHIGLFSKPAPQNMQHLERLYSPQMADVLR